MGKGVEIDRRLTNLFAGEQAATKFIALALHQLLSAEQLEVVVSQLQGRGVDTAEIVAGRSVTYWNGKTASQMLKDLGTFRHGCRTDTEALAAIRAAFVARGWGFNDDLTPPPAEPAEGGTQITGAVQTAGGEADAGKPVTGTLVTTEQLAGTGEGTQAGPAGVEPVRREPLYAGKPLGAYVGKTREQLLSDNISPKMADKIVAALADQAAKAPVEPPPAQ